MRLEWVSRVVFVRAIWSIIWAALMGSGSAYAQCWLVPGANRVETVTYTIPANLSVPRDLPVGGVVWESEPVSAYAVVWACDSQFKLGMVNAVGKAASAKATEMLPIGETGLAWLYDDRQDLTWAGYTPTNNSQAWRLGDPLWRKYNPKLKIIKIADVKPGASIPLGLLGYPLLWDGMRRLSGRRRSLYWIVVLVPAAWLLIGIVSGFPLVNEQRASVFHLTAVISLAASAGEIWLDRLSEPLPARRPLAVGLLISAAIYAVRLVCIVLDIPSTFDFATAFFLQIFFNFWIALLVVTLVRERGEAGLQLAADTDTLTGTGNRRWFLGRIPAAPLANSALAILDVDHFKQINDRFGHPVGDQVLVSVAQAVRDELREGDVFARYGGEEFVLFLPNVSEQEAWAVAERLRKRIEGMSSVIDGTHIHVTVSIGVAWSDEKGGTWDALIKVADSACYEAKYGGRNLVRTCRKGGGSRLTRSASNPGD